MSKEHIADDIASFIDALDALEDKVKALQDEYKRGYNDGYKNASKEDSTVAVEANAKSILVQEMSKIDTSWL